MERFKQTIAKLENDVAELKQFQTKIQGSTQSKGDIYYCTGTQEFGEYELDEIDTFRFAVASLPAGHQDPEYPQTYRYRLLNATPELAAYMQIQNLHWTHHLTEYIPVNIKNIENCIKKGGYTNLVITDEIRKCLDSKLWEFVADQVNNSHISHPIPESVVKKEFYIDIPIEFKNTYTISPHVSFYITPLSNTLDECVIHEITTKQVVFRVKYGNFPKGPCDGTHWKYPNTIYSGLKLHYSITGVVKQYDNLLD